MLVEIKAPTFAESISEAQIGEWNVQEGQIVKRDDVVLELETDKAALEVVAPVSGKIVKLLKQPGDVVLSGEVIAQMEEGAAPVPTTSSPRGEQAESGPSPSGSPSGGEPRVMPSAKRAMSQAGVKAEEVTGSGPGGRILKEDVARSERIAAKSVESPAGERLREVVPMTLIRRKIAQRLVEAQSTAALLTTFNECDMSAVSDIRKSYQEQFTKEHGIKLGFMSFFVKAAVDALKRFPAVNAQIEQDSIVYHNYYDIGVAVGGGKGLVVPVIRSAERLSFSEIEKVIGDFGSRAQQNKIKPEELEGGTFTISNGGIYGSMLSTPIVNPPQSAILGLHAIVDRPVVREGQIVIRPIMNIALTYDHRLIDGREAVQFLKRIKECIENPSRMLVEI